MQFGADAAIFCIIEKRNCFLWMLSGLKIPYLYHILVLEYRCEIDFTDSMCYDCYYCLGAADRR